MARVLMEGVPPQGSNINLFGLTLSTQGQPKQIDAATLGWDPLHQYLRHLRPLLFYTTYTSSGCLLCRPCLSCHVADAQPSR